MVLSADAVCREPTIKLVNVLLCATLRPADRLPKPWKILLDEADSFSRKTVVNCLSIYQPDKTQAGEHLGSVSPTRRRAIARKVIECFQRQT